LHRLYRIAAAVATTIPIPIIRNFRFINYQYSMRMILGIITKLPNSTNGECLGNSIP
jgi:hypothetical protein